MDRRPLGVVLAVMWLCGCAGKLPRASQAIPSSVCQLRAKPAQFVGKRVVVTADVQSDGLHGTFLVGPCRGGISIGFGSPSEPPDVEALFKAVMAGMPGTRGKRIRVTVWGRFGVRSEELDDVYWLSVDHVEDLVVTPVP